MDLELAEHIHQEVESNLVSLPKHQVHGQDHDDYKDCKLLFLGEFDHLGWCFRVVCNEDERDFEIFN